MLREAEDGVGRVAFDISGSTWKGSSAAVARRIGPTGDVKAALCSPRGNVSTGPVY
jgi:hypothetical protein